MKCDVNITQSLSLKQSSLHLYKLKPLTFTVKFNEQSLLSAH